MKSEKSQVIWTKEQVNTNDYEIMTSVLCSQEGDDFDQTGKYILRTILEDRDYQEIALQVYQNRYGINVFNGIYSVFIMALNASFLDQEIRDRLISTLFETYRDSSKKHLLFEYNFGWIPSYGHTLLSSGCEIKDEYAEILSKFIIGLNDGAECKEYIDYTMLFLFNPGISMCKKKEFIEDSDEGALENLYRDIINDMEKNICFLTKDSFDVVDLDEEIKKEPEELEKLNTEDILGIIRKKIYG